MAKTVRTGLLLCTLATLTAAATSRAAEFYRLGVNDLAVGVSPDGSLVLTSGNVWTPAGGFVPYSPSPLIYSRDISNNGYVVGLVDGSYVPARVRAGEPALLLGSLGGPDISDSGDAFGITPDGSVVVGYSYSATGPQAFRWTAETRIVGLGQLVPVSSGNDAAHGVSADGSVVVGEAQTAPELSQAFRWTQATGMVALGDLPGGTVHSVARAVSGDGRVIVGQANTDAGNQAFRWTQESGMVSLGDLPGGDAHSDAWAASADGSVIVGEARTSQFDGVTAFIWTAADGMRSLREVLVEDHGLGPALQDFDPLVAYDVSDDGRTIVGYGVNADDDLEGFVVVIPEPALASGLVFAAALLSLRRAARRYP